jgi:hypothetical protein
VDPSGQISVVNPMTHTDFSADPNAIETTSVQLINGQTVIVSTETLNGYTSVYTTSMSSNGGIDYGTEARISPDGRSTVTETYTSSSGTLKTSTLSGTASNLPSGTPAGTGPYEVVWPVAGPTIGFSPAAAESLLVLVGATMVMTAGAYTGDVPLAVGGATATLSIFLYLNGNPNPDPSVAFDTAVTEIAAGLIGSYFNTLRP